MLRAVSVALLLLAPLVALLPSSAHATAPPASFVVGFGSRDITPGGSVNLGGFGFGCCRPSTANEYPVRVRAMVVGDGVQNAALASVEVQGSFAAYANGAFGQYDIAKRIEAATGGALPRSHIILSSDHSHRGADTTGVWGGLSDAAMQSIADQTQGAVLDAFAARAPARIRVAEIDESARIHSDFNLPGQDTPDGFFRLLFVEDAAGKLSGAYGTFAAHATGHGSAPKLSPDWPGIVSDMVGADLGGIPVVLGEGAVGRTHGAGAGAWERSIADDIEAAYAGSAYVTASGVDGAESAINLNAYNAILFSGLLVGKPGCATSPGPLDPLWNGAGANPTCVPIGRASTPPWMTGNQITTLVSAVRIGDVLVWGAPGEIYPNAQWTVQANVASPHVIVAGLANDQLGYLIAPSEDWPKIASTPTSDNTLFNVDITGGDHVTCATIDLARTLGFATGGGPPICALWQLEDRTLPP